MCGIAGFLFSPSGDVDATTVLQRMTDAVAHRGPDDQGHWLDEIHGVAIGHRRLSIIDLSPTGHQPMISRSGRYVLSLNGEIYNYRDIKRTLGDEVVWRGTSDTEVLLEAIERWGHETALARVAGMFSFAVWDRQTATLTLARDRLGEKPVYFGWCSDNFLFASELKALLNFPGFRRSIDKSAVRHYLRQGSVPAPLSIYEGIQKLLPGHLVSISWTVPRIGESAQRAYWSLADATARPRFGGTPEDAVNELDRLLTEAVRLQSISDVSLGALLSGGIDSSCVVSLMQKISSVPVKTYSIGFENSEFDEAPYAAAIARHLGTAHTEFLVTETEAIDVIPNIPTIWDEPFGDSSQIPTYIVARLARRDVTVALSGDGGDELFLGYSRYRKIARFERVPAKSLLRAILPVGLLDSLEISLGEMGAPIGRLRILGETVAGRTAGERYLNYMFQPQTNDRLFKGTKETARLSKGMPIGYDTYETISAIDAATYLQNDVLTKVDRATMSVGLESRAPLLDHRVVEFAFSLPTEYKMRDGVPKWPLKQLLARHVPPSLTDRPKMGFGVPIADWLRGRLRDWAEELIKSGSCDDLLNMAAVRQLWQAHQKGNSGRTTALWRVLMLLEWRTRYA